MSVPHLLEQAILLIFKRTRAHVILF